MPIHRNNLKVNLKSARASLHAEGLAVPDSHDLANNLTGGKGGSFVIPPIPAIPPIAPVSATVSFDVEWFPLPDGTSQKTTVVNQAQNFRGDFIQTGSTIKWSSNQSGFYFDSEEPNPERLIGAVIGRERNGAFFNAKDDNEDEGDND